MPARAARETPRVDGRHRRSQRSRERILEAVERALADPELEVRGERVAAEAGVSLSTLFRHFGDLDGLSLAMNERLRARIVPIMVRGPFVGGTRARLRDLIDRRNQAFELSAPLRRAAQRAPKRPARPPGSDNRAEFRGQLEAALGPELARMGAEAAAALEALLSPEAWDQLRAGQGLELGAIARTLEAAALSLIGGAAEDG